MSVTLHLVRHGQSVWNVDHRLAGSTDVRLTDHGEAQARALAPILRPMHFDTSWSSDLVRAHNTGTYAWPGDLQLSRELREFNFGDLEGRCWRDLSPTMQRRFGAFHEFEAPGGETGRAFYARVDAFMNTLPAGDHLLFTHGGVIRAVLRHTDNEQFVGNAGITVVDWSGRGFISHRTNPLGA